MRSISTEQRSPVSNSMPGRYKSCRRSTSELFSKEQEQELHQCAQQSEVLTEEEHELEQPVKMAEVTPPKLSPPKLTPLRWRSTSMRDLHGGGEVPTSSRPVEKSDQILQGDDVVKGWEPPQPVEERQAQSAQRPSQAQLRAQVMNSLSVEQASPVHPEEFKNVPPGPNEQAPQNVGVDSSKAVERVNTIERREQVPDNSTNETFASPEGQLNASSVGRPVSEISASRRNVKKSPKPGPSHHSEEVVVFEPVDLDEKYREKELVRHVTAAKIQNREEALLNNPSPPGVNSRKGPVGEEPASMTIEFLRARLQAERSASKATKLRVEQLSKKVMELESRLQAEVELRKSAEGALQDALLKLKQQSAVQADSVIQPTVAPPTSALVSPKLPDAEDGVKTVQRVDIEAKAGAVEPKPPANGEKAAESTSPGKVEKATAEDSSKIVGDKTPAGTVDVKEGGLWRDRSVFPQSPGLGDVTNVSRDSGSGSSPERPRSPSRRRQDGRAAIEERLRSMWAKIGEEMAALAEIRGEGEPDNKDLTGWMDQLPAALQHKHSGDSGTKLQKDHPSNQQVEANGNSKQDLSSSRAPEKRASFKRNASLAKNVAKLVEQYEFQEAAQREWEESLEAKQSLEQQNEDELPALVTRDGDVVTESSNAVAIQPPEGVVGGHRHTRTLSQREINLDMQQQSGGGSLSRSKSTGFLSSQKGSSGGSISRKGSSNGRIEILTDDQTESGVEDEELLFDPETEVAEELPNGIYLHHSRDDSDAFKRGVKSKESTFRKPSEGVGVGAGFNSPSKAHSRERFTRNGDLHGEVDQQGWPVREVQDRASRDMYYDSRGVRVADETMYRNGPRWDTQGMDPNWMPRQDERRMPPHFSHGEETAGIPYGYRDHPLEQDVQYRNVYRHRDDGHRGMPAWQEGADPGYRHRGMTQKSYGYSPPYGVEDVHQSPYSQAGQYPEVPGYINPRQMPYPTHGIHNPRPDHYPPGAMPGPRSSIPVNGYAQPDRPPPSRAAHPGGWEGAAPAAAVHEERAGGTVGAGEDVPGEAGEVLKALRIAKQQIKSSSGEQAAFMTAQYTVSQEHRFGAGGQVSKTSYTVEAPVGYPRVTKTVHEGWHLEGGKASGKKRSGFVGANGVAIDLTGANVTDLIAGAGPLTVTSGESSYVEKLNVGRGIQFFFSG